MVVISDRDICGPHSAILVIDVSYCPRHDPRSRINSISLYFGHPASRYFTVGKLGRDQLVDYHARKGMTLAEAERWLAPNLGYDPAADKDRAA